MVLPAVETAAGRTASPHGHPESERLTEVLTLVVCFMLGPDWVCPHRRLGSSIHYGRGCRLVVGTRRHSGAFSIVSSGDRLGRRFHLNLLRFWSIGHGLLIRTYLRCATLSASVSRISHRSLMRNPLELHRLLPAKGWSTQRQIPAKHHAWGCHTRALLLQNRHRRLRPPLSPRALRRDRFVWSCICFDLVVG